VGGSVGGEFGVGGKAQTVLREFGGDSDRVGNDQRDYEFALSPTTMALRM